MTKLTSVFARLLVVVAVLALSLTAVAQMQNGQITGTVLDQQGAAISGATVKVSNPAINLSVSATTSDTGGFTVKELPAGNYKISVEKQGFKTASQASFTVNVGVTHRVDFKLTVGERTEIVEVTGTAPLVNTEDSKLSTTVSSAQIANLPLNGRNVYDLIKTAPGAVEVAGVISENGNGAVVNGMRENFNGFLINGLSNKGLSGGPDNIPIEDTVQEFQQLTLNNSAQYGNSAGSITNLVTKGGTNDWHGGAWWFIRNDNMDTTPFFIKHTGVDAELNGLTGEPKPELRFNQFGGVFGGPIIKDKLFFFASYQGDRFITSNAPLSGTVESQQWRDAVTAAAIPGLPGQVAGLLYNDFGPLVQGATNVVSLNDFNGSLDFGTYLCPDTYAGLNGDPTGSLHAQAMANIIGVTGSDTVCVPTLGGAFPVGPVIGTFGSRDNPFENSTVAIFKSQGTGLGGNLYHGNEASLRLDWVPRDKDRLFAEFKWLKYTDAFGPQSPSGARGFVNPTKTITPHFSLSWVHTFSPTILNEFRAGYTGASLLTATSFPGVPSVYFDSGEMNFGSYNGYPQFFKENVYSYSDMLSISHGKHNIKIGYDLRRNIENSEFDIARPSYYFFDELFFAVDAPYGGVAGVQPCIPSTVFGMGAGCAGGSHLETNNRHWRNWEHGVYFQDDWKISRRLTLNLGIRYDLFQRHTELNDLATTFIKGPGTNVVDDITTGAGWLANANIPAGLPGCDDPVNQIPFAQLAGVCGPGGFAASKSLGKGDHNNFGPRVGFAWDIFGTGKTSLRGGFGVAYEGTLYNPLSNSRWNLPYYSFNDFSIPAYGPQDVACLPVSYTGAPCPANHEGAAGTPSGVGNIQGWDQRNPNLATLTGIILPEGIRDPYVYNFYLSFQHELPGKMVIETRYVGTAGHKLFRAQDINRIPGGRMPVGTCVTDSLGRNVCGRTDATNPDGLINPNYGHLRNWQNSVNSNYNSFQLLLRKQTSHGVTFDFNYTWSHSLDTGSTWHSGATSANGRAGGDSYSTDQFNPKLDYGNSIYDIRHRWVFSYIWEMPWYKNAKGLKGAILGGWQWNGVWSFQTGAHWSPYCRSISSCDFDKNDLPRYVGNRPDALAPNFNATHDMWANGWGSDFFLGGVGAGSFFSRPCDPSPAAAVVCYGNLRRNQFVGPNFFNADISLFKMFNVTERVKLQFRAEAYNVLNRTNFQLPGNPNNRLELGPLGLFGLSSTTFNPRQLQLGLKLNF